MPMQPMQNNNRITNSDPNEETKCSHQPQPQIQAPNQAQPQAQPQFQSFPGQDSTSINAHQRYQHGNPLQGAPFQQPLQDPNVQNFPTQPGLQVPVDQNPAFQQQQQNQWQQQIHQNPNYAASGSAQQHTISQEIPIQHQTAQSAQAFQNLQGMVMRTKFYQVGRVLELMAETGDVIPHANSIITPFHSLEIPRYSIIWYFVILSYNSGLDDEQAPAVLVLIERLCNTAAQQGAPIIINSYTIHRLILTTVLITSKFYNDIYFANQFIASVGGVPTQNLNQLEDFYLEMIDWNLYISPEDFESYAAALATYSSEQNTQLNLSPQAQRGNPTVQTETMSQSNQGGDLVSSPDSGSAHHPSMVGSMVQHPPQQVVLPPQSPPPQIQQQQQTQVHQLSPQEQLQATLQQSLAAQQQVQQPQLYYTPQTQSQQQQPQMRFQHSQSLDDSTYLNQLQAQTQQQMQQQALIHEQQRRMSSEFQSQQQQQQYALLQSQQQQEIQRRLSSEFQQVQQQQQYLQQQQLLQYQAQQLQAQAHHPQQQVQQVPVADLQPQVNIAAYPGQIHPQGSQSQLPHGQDLNQIQQQQQVHPQDMNQIQQQYMLLQQQQQQQQQQMQQRNQQQLGNNFPGPNQN